MDNWITEQTLELWAENIEYLIDHEEDGSKLAHQILKYLEDEGAFAVTNS